MTSDPSTRADSRLDGIRIARVYRLLADLDAFQASTESVLAYDRKHVIQFVDLIADALNDITKVPLPGVQGDTQGHAAVDVLRHATSALRDLDQGVVDEIFKPVKVGTSARSTAESERIRAWVTGINALQAQGTNPGQAAKVSARQLAREGVQHRGKQVTPKQLLNWRTEFSKGK